MTTPSLTLARLDAIDRDHVHYFEYKDTPFLYVVPSMQSVELRAETAHVARLLLKGKGKSIRVAPGQFDKEDLLAAYDRLKGLSEDVRSSAEEVRQEQKRFQLVQEEVDDLERFKRAQQSSRKDHYVYFSRRCNLACSYCWNDGGTLGEDAPLEPNPSFFEDVVDCMIEGSGDQKHLKVIVYGGEPLLNIRGIRYFTDYAAQRAAKTGKEFEYLLDTNGTIWNNEIAQVARDHNFDVMVSIDGPAPVHDAHRVFRDGRPSHETIMKNVEKMMHDLPGKVGARSILQDASFSLTGSYNFLRPFRFHEIQVFYNLFSGYTGGKRNRLTPYRTIEQYRQELAQEVDYILDRLSQGLLPQIDSTFLNEMKLRAAGRRKYFRCLPAMTQMAFQSDGKIYPCVYFNGDDYCLGDVKTGITRWELLQKLCKSNVFTQKACSTCWTRFACGGCCQARCLACHEKGDRPIRLQCERTREELKAFAYLGAKLADYGDQVSAGLLEAASGEIPMGKV